MRHTRPFRRLAAALALISSVALFMPATAGATTGENASAGEAGAGPAASNPVVAAPARSSFSDVDSSLSWAAPAIRYVAVTNNWMTDFGTDKFRPKINESRKLFARAIVRAFAPTEPTDPNITFSDIETTDRFYSFANVAVKMGWMQRTKDGAFRPDDPVTMTQVHYALISALPLQAEVDGLTNIHTADGYQFAHSKKFPQILLGMLLHFRYNHPTEGQDVTPKDPLSRAEVAYSLWRAARVSPFTLQSLTPYQTITLPAVNVYKRKFIEFGMKYVGYPYIWGGDWYTKTPAGYCCGAQPQGGFDCSGLMWWDLKAPAGGYNNRFIRHYRGWNLPQRVAADMASVGKHITYKGAKPGDLMFYSSAGPNGYIDHVDVYLGNGWALDSSSGQGGVTILRISSGWYRDHFVHARRIMTTRSAAS